MRMLSFAETSLIKKQINFGCLSLNYAEGQSGIICKLEYVTEKPLGKNRCEVVRDFSCNLLRSFILWLLYPAGDLLRMYFQSWKPTYSVDWWVRMAGRLQHVISQMWLQ